MINYFLSGTQNLRIQWKGINLAFYVKPGALSPLKSAGYKEFIKMLISFSTDSFAAGLHQKGEF